MGRYRGVLIRLAVTVLLALVGFLVAVFVRDNFHFSMGLARLILGLVVPLIVFGILWLIYSVLIPSFKQGKASKSQ